MTKSRPELPSGIDPSSRFGAWTIAEHIMEVWRRRGYGNVVASRVQVSENTWGVRSNLVNGMPPARRR